jgi:hypothetical protein
MAPTRAKGIILAAKVVLRWESMQERMMRTLVQVE